MVHIGHVLVRMSNNVRLKIRTNQQIFTAVFSEQINFFFFFDRLKTSIFWHF